LRRHSNQANFASVSYYHCNRSGVRSGRCPFVSLPLSLWESLGLLVSDRGTNMKALQVWWVALGFLIARWVYKRQPILDPVARLRCMGGL